MKSKTPHLHKKNKLRQKAEQKAHHIFTDPQNLSAEQIKTMIQELQVHQIELEMQNNELQKTQQELELSQKQFFDLYDLAPVGYITLNNDGLILRTNLTAANLLNRTKRDLIDKHLHSFICFDDQDIFYHFKKQFDIKNVQPQVCIVRFIKHKAILFWARLEMIAAPDNNNCVSYRVAISDISQQIAVMENLKESEEKFRSLIDNTSDLIYSLDNMLCFTGVNKMMCKVHDLQPEDFIGKSLSELQYQNHEVSQWIELCNTVLTCKTNKELEINILVADGLNHCYQVVLTPVFDHKGIVIGIRGTNRDITEQKQSERLQKLSSEIMKIINECTDLLESITTILATIKKALGYDALAIRLHKNNDYPYVIQNGFSNFFLSTENSLFCQRKNAMFELECLCGLVIKGQTDQTNSLFTQGGSAWTNNLAEFTEKNPDLPNKYILRHKCIQEGFQSLALIPIRANKQIVGLLQLNDHKKNCFTLRTVQFFEGISASIGIAFMRKQAEEHIREREIKFRSLFENTNDAIILLDMTTGCYVDCNRMAQNITGYTHQEICSMRSGDLLLPARKDDSFQNVQKIKASGTVRGETELLTKTGTLLPVEYNSSILQMGNKQHMVSVIRDISERKRMDTELIEKRMQLESIVRLQKRKLSQTKETLDLQTKERLRVEQELLHRQEALEAVYKMATAFTVSIETLYDQIVVNICQILSTPLAIISEYIDSTSTRGSMFKDGTLTHIRNTSHPCAFCHTIRTDGKPFRFKGNLKQLINTSSGFSPKLCFDTDRFHSYIGVPIKNYKGHAYGIICVIDDQDREFSDSETRLVEIFGQYLANELSRNELQNQLRRAEEMKLLGQLTSGVAHEVRNPLNGILAIMSVLNKEFSENELFTPHLHHMRNQVSRLTQLMDALLTLGRPIQQEKLIAISLLDLIDRTLASWLQSHADAILRVEFIKPPTSDEYVVAVDILQMAQVIINLLENAYSHAPSQTSIVLSLKTINHTSVSFSIKDSGPGIAPDILPRIFEPFFTTRKQGIGLGLSIVQRIVENHKGRIQVENSSDGPGVSFSVELPRYIRQ